MGDYPVMTQYGYTDTPGRWDHLATGQVLSQAKDGMVNGKVVISPSDLVTVFRRYIELPVTLTIRDGYVVDIAGGRHGCCANLRLHRELQRSARLRDFAHRLGPFEMPSGSTTRSPARVTPRSA